MVSSFALFFSLSSYNCKLNASVCFTISASRSLIPFIFSRTYLSYLSMWAMLAAPAESSYILALAFASCSYFFLSISLPLASLSSYSSLILLYLHSAPSNFPSFFFISPANLFALLRWPFNLLLFSFSSVTSIIKCYFISISLPSCSLKIFISVCCRSIFLSR